MITNINEPQGKHMTFKGRSFADAIVDTNIIRKRRPLHREPVFVTNESGEALVFVPLTNHAVSAVVDRADYDRLASLGLPLNWLFNMEAPAATTNAKGSPHARPLPPRGYVRAPLRGATGNLVTVARVLVDAGKGDRVFYADGDPLNLRRSNLILRVRTHNQYATVAAMHTAAMKLVADRSYRVAMRRKSLRRPNMRSMTLRFL